MAARGKPTIQPITSHPVQVKPTRKVETPVAAAELENNLLDPAPNVSPTGTASNDSDDNIPLSEIKAKLQHPQETGSNIKQSPNPSRKKMEFVSKTVSLIKWKRKRSFKFTKCNDRYPTQGVLNQHFHDNHSRVSCPHCSVSFSTLCSLTQHMYVNEIATKKCRCGQTFRFESELKVHKLKHRWLPTLHCVHPNCMKS